MIYGAIDTIERYLGIHDNLDKAIEYIMAHDFKDLPAGRTVVDADCVYINVMNASLLKEDEGSFESHRRYLDLHIDIEGNERILIGEYSEEIITKEYSEKDDYELLDCDTACKCYLDDSHFCICMLNEPHKPCVSNAEGKIRKAVIKILMD